MLIQTFLNGVHFTVSNKCSISFGRVNSVFIAFCVSGKNKAAKSVCIVG